MKKDKINKRNLPLVIINNSFYHLPILASGYYLAVRNESGQTEIYHPRTELFVLRKLLQYFQSGKSEELYRTKDIYSSLTEPFFVFGIDINSPDVRSCPAEKEYNLVVTEKELLNFILNCGNKEYKCHSMERVKEVIHNIMNGSYFIYEVDRCAESVHHGEAWLFASYHLFLYDDDLDPVVTVLPHRDGIENRLKSVIAKVTSTMRKLHFNIR